MQLTHIPIRQILPGRNPREHFDAAEMAALQASVKEQGVLQPILVRPRGAEQYEIVAGERRWRAAQAVLGDDYPIPAMIKEMDDREAAIAALTENVQRANMSPAEEAEAAAKVLGLCLSDRNEAARLLGWSRSTFDKRLGLMHLTPKVRSALTQRRIQLGHAELLAAIVKEKQDVVLDRLVAQPTLPAVADFRRQLEQIAQSLAAAFFDKADCAGCPHNSGNQKALFAEAIAEGNCTDSECYQAKTEATLVARKDAMKDEYPTVRIVRAGENETLIKVVPDGQTGLGEDQAKACRACANFGAAVSAVPGKVGNVYRDICFDPTCNARKLAQRLQAERAAKGAPRATGAATKKGVTATKQRKVEVAATPEGVKRYREKVWRETLKAELLADGDRALVVLLALATTRNARHLDIHEDMGISVGEAARSVAVASHDKRREMLVAMAAAATKEMGLNSVTELLAWMEAEPGKHWTLNKEYLDLLTKSEIQVVAEELGIKAAIGEGFAKNANGKKDEFIKAVLSAPGFDYAGKVPTQMRWDA